ncbi:hypothetical protein [Thalassoglobus polymorphus]|uniref:Uncharacterized protein n=1 Tax=Thalassoglobus polymorphus TaxID=2527994 RepID=A0A517QTQ9_9PLAN|nr:hypothetical protein [Thalassoglobus polymorphus]QDT35029.1 hypothetical protein Mal48_43030 [Thalassoglobus polymorphus]
MSFRFVLLFFLSAGLSSPALYADETTELLDSVSVSWDEHRSRSATAKIHFFSAFIDCKEQKFSVEDVHRLVAEFEFSADEEFMQEFVSTFHPEVIERHRQHDQSTGPWDLWDDVVLLDDGINRRSIGRRNEHIVARGLHLMYSKHLSQQITAFEEGRCMVYFYDRDWFLGIPPAQVLEQVEHAHSEAGSLKLSGKKSGDWVLDAETHLPISQTSMDDQSKYGRLTYYKLPTIFPGDVTAPAMRVEVDFRDGIAQKAELTAIVDAEFNLDIPKTAFVVPAKEGAAMVDQRSEERHARALKHDIEDAAEYFLANGIARKAVAATPISGSERKFDWKAFFLIANGISLIVLGVVLWRRSAN